ncbi:MAG: AMP-binding protein, partial [Acidobacteriaceae bacterium]|nr:AMP-binding protein [Acidobacteriaceae bacterium]
MGQHRSHLGSLVEDFERHGADIAVVARRGLREKRTTYRDLASLARRFAAELSRREIKKGDRVLLWGENSPEWIAAFFGCVMRGVLPVPVDVAGSHDFAERVIREVTPKLVVGDRDNISALSHVEDWLALQQFEEQITREEQGVVPDLAESDPLQIVFTSGTTGEPKGVVHTHANVLASLRPIETEMDKYLKYEKLVHPIRILHTLPLSHVFGQFMGLWIPALLSAELHFESRLVAAELVDYIRQHRISVLAAVPRVLDLLESYVVAASNNVLAGLHSAGNRSALHRWWQ